MSILIGAIATAQAVGATASEAANNDVGLPPRASFTTLLTTESLIFAAFAISANLALPTPSGRSKFYAQGRFAYWVVAALFVIAISAGFALYATLEPAPPRGVNAWARTVGIVVGIAVQPLAALAIARAAKKTKPSFRAEE